MDAVDVGRRIAERRKSLRLGQDVLATLLGVSRSTISLYEQGKIPITAMALYMVADKLRVPVRYLMGEMTLGELMAMESENQALWEAKFEDEARRITQQDKGLRTEIALEDHSRGLHKKQLNELFDKLTPAMRPIAIRVLAALVDE